MSSKSRYKYPKVKGKTQRLIEETNSFLEPFMPEIKRLDALKASNIELLGYVEESTTKAMEELKERLLAARREQK